MSEALLPAERGRIAVPAIAAAATAALAAGLLPPLLQRAGPLVAGQRVLEATAEVAAAALAAAGAVWLCFHLLYARRHLSARTFAYLPLLFAVAAIVDTGGIAIQRMIESGFRSAPERFGAGGDPAAVALALSDSALALRVIAQRKGGTVPLHESGTDAGFGSATKTLVNSVGAALESENREIAAVGFPKFLIGADLKARGGYAAARARLERMRAIRTRYNHAVGDAIGAYRAWIAASQLDEDVKGKALAQLDRWAAVDRDLRARQLAAANAFADDCEAMLRDLANTRAPWTAKGGKLIFHDVKDADIYQAHLNAAAGDLRRLNATLRGH